RIAVTLFVPFLLAVPLAHSASAQFAPGQQFAPYSPPLYAFDRVEGECVNLETELIAPILCIPDPGPTVPGGDLVAVANDADERVVFLDMNLALVGEVFVGQGPSALALNPAAPELWVSVRNQSSVVIIDLLSLTVKQVLRPAIDPRRDRVREREGVRRLDVHRRAPDLRRRHDGPSAGQLALAHRSLPQGGRRSERPLCRGERRQPGSGHVAPLGEQHRAALP